MSSYIFGQVNQTVNLGTQWSTPLTIEYGAVVSPAYYGAGVYSNTAGVSLTNRGSISGARGDSGGYDGAIGVDLKATATVANAGRILGGQGGDYAPGYGYTAGGAGGVGVVMTGGTLTNTGSIGGGAGGVSEDAAGNGGVGGSGVLVTGGALLTNMGSIYGGAGGSSKSHSGGGGGVGVYLDGGTLITAGAIAGGAGGSGLSGTASTGYAVKLGPVASTLEVQSGASFTGFVVADPQINDTLETGGSTAGVLTDVGEEFLGFSTVKFGAGSYWTVQAQLTPHVFGGAQNDHLTVDLTPGNTFEFTNAPFSEVPPIAISGTNAYITIDGVTTEFVGVLTPGDIFTIAGTGPTSTEFTVRPDLNSHTTTNITLGSGNYSYRGLYVEPTGSVAPSTGTAVTSDQPGGYLTNAGTLKGGTGGQGVDLGGGDTLTNHQGGTIDGGDGGAGVDDDGSSTVNSGAVDGGNNGNGVNLQDGGALTNEDNGTIRGGYGAAGVDDDGGSTDNSGAIDGGNDGNGVDLQDGGTLTNEDNGTITGGYGAAGVDDNDSDATNSGTIDGGDGGDGADLSGGTLTNSGDITGGAGGEGVSVHGGTVINDGSISAGSATYKIPFPIDMSLGGPNASTLVVQPAATFNGPVQADYATYDNDTLGLDAGYYDPTLSGFGTQFTGFAKLDFMSGQWTVDSTTAAVDGPKFQIDGFSAADTLHLTDLTLNSGATNSFNDGVLTINNPGVGTIDINFDNTNGTVFSVVADASGGTDITCACFRRGTLIQTPHGEVAIETLRIGDRVQTLSGVSMPIRWIGRRRYSGWSAWGNPQVCPILIGAGAIADEVPSRNLWVSPEHALFIDGLLIPAAALVNGTTIVQDQEVDEVTYIHLEFATHTVIFAQGVASESFVDDDSRGMFDNAHEYATLCPDALSQPATFCAPRAEDGAALEAVRQRLAVRAARPSVNQSQEACERA
jgi:Hint domain